jgi:hypothetical protein
MLRGAGSCTVAGDSSHVDEPMNPCASQPSPSSSANASWAWSGKQPVGQRDIGYTASPATRGTAELLTAIIDMALASTKPSPTAEAKQTFSE